MTIEEAIKRLERNIKWRKPDPEDNLYKAIQLGIEALKWVAEDRRINEFPHVPTLRGESQ